MAEFIGKVATNRVGSEVEFEFYVDDDDLAEAEASGEKFAVDDLMNTALIQAMWESGSLDVTFEKKED